jgi:hypothetical protein
VQGNDRVTLIKKSRGVHHPTSHATFVARSCQRRDRCQRRRIRFAFNRDGPLARFCVQSAAARALNSSCSSNTCAKYLPMRIVDTRQPASQTQPEIPPEDSSPLQANVRSDHVRCDRAPLEVKLPQTWPGSWLKHFLELEGALSDWQSSPWFEYTLRRDWMW